MSSPLLDPLAAPVIALGGEAALPAERLDSAWLRQRLAHPPVWAAEDHDEQHWHTQTRAIRPAAVLIAIVLHAQPTVLFTQRTADLSDHPGQISFPGGRVEYSDASPSETALRESEEEIGLARAQVEIIGRLPDYYTGTGYCIAPVVALVQPPLALRPDPREVAEIFEVPLAFLMDGSNHQRRLALSPTARRTFYTMPYQDYVIWGATAGMLRNLFHLLRS